MSCFMGDKCHRTYVLCGGPAPMKKTGTTYPSNLSRTHMGQQTFSKRFYPQWPLLGRTPTKRLLISNIIQVEMTGVEPATK